MVVQNSEMAKMAIKYLGVLNGRKKQQEATQVVQILRKKIPEMAVKFSL